MAQVPYQPQNVAIDQSDGDILLTWDGVLGATGYIIQRSTDGANFTNLATVGIVNDYIDSLPGVGQMFYYQVIATNAAGNSSPSIIVKMVSAYPAEMSMYELMLRMRQTADRVDSSFVTDMELRSLARLAAYELYDILITSFEDWFAQAYAFITTDGTTANYPLPNGVNNYLGGTYGGTNGTPAPALYKLAGIDLNVNTSTITPSRVTLLKYDFIKRNQYIYPNSTSTIYGVYNMRYRMMGDKLDIIPTPSQGQNLLLWYSPKMPRLLKDTDLTVVGVSGWLRYVIVRGAIYLLSKEEGTDVTQLNQELLFLKQRIEQASQNRDAGIPDTISETRQDPVYGGTGWGGGNQGGWAVALFPGLFSCHSTNGLLSNSINGSEFGLAYAACGILFAYLFYLHARKQCCWIGFSRVRWSKTRLPSLRNLVRNIFNMSSEE